MAGNPLAVSVRLEHRSLDRAAGQRRHDLRRGPQPGYVSAERSPLNSVLVEPKGAAELRTLCEARRAKRPTKRRMKADAAVASCGIITFGREAQALVEALPRDDQDLAVLAVAEAIAGRVGVELTGLVVHRDEAAIHAHFQMPAMAPDGQLVSRVIKPAVASELQDLAARAIIDFAPGVERGTPKAERLRSGDAPAEVVHKSVRQLHRELPADLAAVEARLAEALSRAEAAEADLTKKQRLLDGTLAKLAEATVDLDKLDKRRATYERRVADAEAALRQAREAVEAVKREGTEAKDKAARVVVEAEKEAGRIKAEATAAAETVLLASRKAQAAALAASNRVEALEQREATLQASCQALADAATASEERARTAHARADADERRAALVRQDAERFEDQAAEAQKRQAVAEDARAKLEADAKAVATTMAENTKRAQVAEARLEPLRGAVAALDAWEADKAQVEADKALAAWWAMTPQERVTAMREQRRDAYHQGASHEELDRMDAELDQLRAEAGTIVRVTEIDRGTGQIAGKNLRTGEEVRARVVLTEKERVEHYPDRQATTLEGRLQAARRVLHGIQAAWSKLVVGSVVYLGALRLLPGSGERIAAVAKPCDPPRLDPRTAPMPEAAKPATAFPEPLRQAVRSASPSGPSGPSAGP